MVLGSCTDKIYVLREGDLIFQANEGNSFVEAIEAVTVSGDKDMSFSHVGIIHFDKQSGVKKPYVVEATPSGGVRMTPLRTFLDDSAHDKDGNALVRVRRYPDSRLARAAARRSLGHIGKVYDFAFTPGDKALYCSELVYECFLDGKGRPLFRSNPMTFKDSTGATSPLWEEYYSRLGSEIPEGVGGTNPNDMYKEEFLRKVDVDFGKIDF